MASPAVPRLARRLEASDKPRATPRDALSLATAKWLRGERLDIGRMAKELGIGRATMFRWVGSRDELYAAVLEKLYAAQRRRLLETAEGTGLVLFESVVRRNLELLAEAPPLRKFIEHDPEYAIRLLTSPSGAPQQQSVQLEVELLERVVAEEGVTPELDLVTLAHVIVRIGEAYLYSGTIGGHKPDIDAAVAAMRILVASGKPTAARKRAGAPARKRGGAVKRSGTDKGRKQGPAKGKPGPARRKR